MLAQSHARKPAPPLAARAAWLRLHGGADAFGSALGDAVVGSIARGDGDRGQAKQDARAAQEIGLNRDQEDRIRTGQTVTDFGDPYADGDGDMAGSTGAVRRSGRDRLRLGDDGPLKSSRELEWEAFKAKAQGIISDHGAVGRPSRGVSSSGEMDASELYRQGLGDIRETVLSVTGGAEAAVQAVEQARSAAQATYGQMRDEAVLESNPAKYVGATFGELAADVGYDFARAGIGLYNLATSSQARSQAAQTVGYVVTNPGVVVNAAVNGARDFWNKPFNEQAQSVFKGGLSTFAGAGIGKMAAAAGGITLRTAGDVAGRSPLWLDSTVIRQSQQSISYAKKAGHTLDDIARGFAENPDHPDLIIDVVRMSDGGLTSLDNSRPAVLNARGGGQIQARVRGYNEPLMNQSDIDRFTAKRDGQIRVPSTWGDAVDYRIWKQGDQFMTQYPNGTSLVPKITGAPSDSIWSQFSDYPWKR